METISIIIPIYKSELTIKRCIESILKQKYNYIEIILVDDGSPDKCGEICDDYAQQDGRIKVIHKKNGGVSSARNCGLDIATGNYILFVDSDDYLPDNALQNYAAHFIPEGEWYIARHVVDDAGKISRPKGLKSSYHFTLRDDKADIFSIIHSTAVFYGPCAKLYCAEIIRANNIRFDSSLNLGEDHLFNLEYFYYIHNIVVIQKTAYAVCISNKESLSRKPRPDIWKVRYLFYCKYKELAERYPELHKIYPLPVVLMHELYGSIFKAVGYSEAKQIVKKIIADEVAQSVMKETKYMQLDKKMLFFPMRHEWIVLGVFMWKLYRQAKLTLARILL